LLGRTSAVAMIRPVNSSQAYSAFSIVVSFDAADFNGMRQNGG
jgi:hypothetical protein